MHNTIYNTLSDVDELVDVEELLDVDFGSQLIVYNDEVNTFDWVIKSFMEVCDHSMVQAEQLSMLVHYKGKACAKTDEFDVLKPMKDALVERGLSAVIESIKDKK